MMLILGILIGIVLSLAAFMGAFAAMRRYETPAQRFLNHAKASLSPKGKIIEPQSADLDDWISTLPNEN